MLNFSPLCPVAIFVATAAGDIFVQTADSLCMYCRIFLCRIDGSNDANQSETMTVNLHCVLRNNWLVQCFLFWKITVLHLLRIFFGTLRFITVFTRARHLFLS